jgi:uncharacterized membrane protein HdeD (DUF308 family)
MAQKNDVGKAGWLLVLSGLLMLLVGFMLFITPVQTISALVFFLGLVFLVCGVLGVVQGILAKESYAAAYIVATSALSAIIGIILLVADPYVTAGALLTFGVIAILLAILAVFSGIAHLVLAVKGKKERWWMLLIAVVYILLGLLILLNPLISIMAFASLIGLFTMLYGLLVMIVGWRINEIAEV